MKILYLRSLSVKNMMRVNEAEGEGLFINLLFKYGYRLFLLYFLCFCYFLGEKDKIMRKMLRKGDVDSVIFCQRKERIRIKVWARDWTLIGELWLFLTEKTAWFGGLCGREKFSVLVFLKYLTLIIPTYGKYKNIRIIFDIHS